MKKYVSYIIMLAIVPTVILIGQLVFKNKEYAFVSLAIAVISCIPFFLAFERKKHTTSRLIMVGVMTALSVVGRIVFAVIPGFKPVTAMIIITGVYFGSETGFMVGSLTAVISNFYFGQGAWTPFQMLSWGFIGLLAGIFAEKLKKSKLTVVVFGALSGVIFSLLMDFWNTLWWDGFFNIKRYMIMIGSSAWFTLIYAVSNVIFLIVLMKPMGDKIERVKIKFNI